MMSNIEILIDNMNSISGNARNSLTNEMITEQIVHDAFLEKGDKTWREIQYFLYNLNLKMMNEGFKLGNRYAEKEWALRNLIKRIEQQHLKFEKIPEEIKSSQEFITWLKQRIYSHRVNHSPLFDLFDNDDMSTEEIRFF